MDNRQGCFLYTEEACKRIDFPKADATVNEIRYFIDAVENNKNIEIASPKSVAETLKIEDMLSESAEQGGKFILNYN